MSVPKALKTSLLIVAATACSAGANSRLSGRWLGEQVANVDAAQLAPATAWVRGTSFEFSGSNVTVTIPTELPRTGSYEVERQDEDSLVIAIRNPNGALDRAALTLVTPDTLQWHIGEGRSVLLRRVD